MTTQGDATPRLPDDLLARLNAAGVTDDASLQAALARDPQLKADFEAALIAPLLVRFEQTQNEQDMLALWRETPTALEEPLVAAVEAAIAQARQRGDSDAAIALRVRLDDFQRIRERAQSQQAVPPLLAAIQAFVTAEDWETSQRVLEQHPELLGDEAIALLGQFAQAARGQGDANAAGVFEEHARLLRRCAEVGVAQAFAEKAGGPDLPADFRDDLNRAQAAERRYLERGEPAELDEAVAAWERILLSPRFAAAPQPFHLAVMNAAGGTRLRRYWARGHLEDLDRALDLWQQAVALTPPDSPDRASRLNNLGAGLHARYARTDAPADLEAAIAHWQQAVALTPPDSPDRAIYLNNLGDGLRARYARTGALADLEAAIEAAQQAVALTPPDSPARAALLNNLGAGLRARYARTGAPADLEAAIEAAQQAVALTPPDSPDRAMYLNNLGDGLRARYARTGAPADLEAAIEATQQAVALTPPDSPTRAMYLNNLGDGLRARYARTGAPADLEAAIAHWQQAVALTPPDSPDRAALLNNLGAGLHARYARTGAPADLEAAIARYREACSEGLQDNPDTALTSARTWLRWAVERNSWAEVAEASRSVRLASTALVAVQWERADKVSRLREVQGLAALGAYAHARVSAPAGAAEVLEAGLARLLGEALEGNRRDLERLPKAERERYRHAVERWSMVAGSPTARLGEPALDAQRLHAERAAARAELDAAIAAIRALPGYEDFFLPLPFDRIQVQARPERPLAYLATTTHGSAIIVVWPDRAEAALSDVTEAELNALLVETDPAGQNVTGGYLPAQLARSDWLPAALAKLMPALGKLLGPLAERLRAGGAQGVVLIPSGRLGLLPLHAAVLEDGRCLLDEFEVSYAPLAQALREARANAEQRAAAPFRLAGVGNPLPNPAPLAFARPELQSVVELLPAGSATPLYEEAATRPALLAALPGATAAHLSCHGNFEPSDPLDSGLQLGDGALTLREILDHPEPFAAARLAVLSACQTSVTDFRNLPDEAIGLPAGILQAGVPGVIGTLWSVDDESTALLMVRCYEFMLFEGMTPCAALRAAQRWLREITNAELGWYLAQHKALKEARQTAGERMAKELERPVRARALSGDPQARPFADPVHWAAFTFSGAEAVHL